MGSPKSVCKTFGLSERIRVPLPAAKISAKQEASILLPHIFYSKLLRMIILFGEKIQWPMPRPLLEKRKNFFTKPLFKPQVRIIFLLA